MVHMWGQLAGSEDSQSGQIWAGGELASPQGAGSVSLLDHFLKPRLLLKMCLHLRQSQLGLGPGVPRKPSECSSFVAGVSFKLEDVVPSFARQTDSKVAIPGPGYHSWKEILEEALGSVAACVTY